MKDDKELHIMRALAISQKTDIDRMAQEIAALRASQNLVKLGHKEYGYKHTSRKTYYVTINGAQVGAGYNSLREIALAHERILRGEWPPSTFPFEEIYPSET